MDWGSARPFCVLWVAVSDGELPQFPRGALIIYREWYGTTGQPNVGLRMPAEQVGTGIMEWDGDDKIGFSVLDPAAFSSDGGPSIAERIARAGPIFRRADNARVGRLGAMGGWDQLRARLIGVDDRPGLYVFATCQHLIRTLPALQHDPDRPEDVDTEAEDHAPDTLRYACLARPYVVEKPQKPRNPMLRVGVGNEVTMDDLWDANEPDRDRI